MPKVYTGELVDSPEAPSAGGPGPSKYAGPLLSEDDFKKQLEEEKRRNKKPPEDPTSVKNLIGAAVEPNLSLLSGAFSGPASGLAGIAGTVLPGPEGQGAAWQKSIADKFTYAPRTTGGKNAGTALAYLPHKIEEAGRYVGGKAQDMGAPPWLATGIDTGLEALAALPAGALARKGMAGVDAAADAIRPYTYELGRNPVPSAGKADLRALSDANVSLTPGMLGGPMWSKAEQSVGKWPFIGSPIQGARANSVLDLNRAVWSKVLGPIGGALPKEIPAGHRAAEYTRRNLQDNYEFILRDIKVPLNGRPEPKAAAPAAPGQLTPPPTPSLSQRLDAIVKKASEPDGLPPKELRVLRGQVKAVKESFDLPGGMASGKKIQNVLEQLRTQRDNFKSAPDGFQRNLARELKNVSESIRDEIEAANPQKAKAWADNNRAWALYTIAKRAANAKTAKEGVFPPSALHDAVRAGDYGTKTAFSEGRARMQDLSGPAKRVLSDTLPDSGTPYQMALMDLLLGGGGGYLGGPVGVGMGLAAPLAYSRPALSLWQRMALGAHPQFGRAVGERFNDAASMLPQQQGGGEG